MKLTLVIIFAMLLAGCGGGSVPAMPVAAPVVTTQAVLPPVIIPTQPWEGDNIEDGSTIKVGGTFYRFYCAGPTTAMDIGYATSGSAGFPRIWTKNPSNPIIHANEFYFGAGISVCAPRVLKMPDGSYRMYVHAHDGEHDRGYLLTATNFPNSWQTENGGQPIFSEGALGQWDGYRVQTQSIIPATESPDGLWHLFYVGDDRTNFRGGHATSTDGIAWTRDPANPIMGPDGNGWHSHHLAPLGWFKKDATYYILAQGHNGTAWSLGYYASTDLRHFTASPAPILTGTAGSWSASGIEGGDTFTEGGTTYIFYLGSNVQNLVSGGLHYRMGVASWK